MSFFDYPIYSLPDLTDVQVSTAVTPVVYVTIDEYGSTEETLLGKILSAAKFDLNTIAIHKIEPTNSVDALKAVGKQQQLIIAFGVTPLRLGVNCDKTPYQLINISGKTILLSDSLMTLSSDSNKKKALWIAIKKYYQL